MAPMNWLTLFLFFSMCLYLILSHIYFFYLPSMPKMQGEGKLTKSNYWNSWF
uniref:ATP synthase F0 subunit 8 n=1 Tax=Franklinothrips vespiformis TaxID=297892 RepID=A0A8A5L707_FRAVS|nr:ATP synthase F0 subunit 8 [Franklinothrips vespiformis]